MPGAVATFLRATLNRYDGKYEYVRRKGLADNRHTEPRPVQAIGNVLRALPRWRETRLEEPEDCYVFSGQAAPA